MKILAGWIVLGAIAAIWAMVLITLNIGGENDRLGKDLKSLPKGHQMMALFGAILLLFIGGPFGLADVIHTEYRNWQERKKSR